MYKVRLKCLVGKSEWIRRTFKKEKKNKEIHIKRIVFLCDYFFLIHRT